VKKIRWIKPIPGVPRAVGTVEENDDDLCALWVEKGLAEYVNPKTKTTKQEKDEDYEARSRGVESPKNGTTEDPQRHKAVTSPKKK